MATTAIHTDILNGMVDYYFRGEAMPAPLQEVYLGLIVDAAGTEVAGGGYSRIPLFGKMDAPTDGLCRNSLGISYARATSPWGTVAGIGFYDAFDEGTLLAGGPVRKPREIVAGDVLTFGAGEVKLSLAANISPYFRDAILRWMLYGEAMPAAPTKPYLGLLRSASPGDEVSGGGYARVPVAGLFDPATGGATTNAMPIAMPTPTDTWQTVTHVCYFDAPAGGNAHFITPFDSAFTPMAGDTVRFNIASLVVRTGA